MFDSLMVAPILPFPNVYWWSNVLNSKDLILEQFEHFEKMSFRNRYMIASSSGVITLSIPIAEGRQQRKAMNEVLIDNKVLWQKQHWRSLVTAYNRSPYFEYFENDLNNLYSSPFDTLIDFSLASIEAVCHLMKKKISFQLSAEYIKKYPEVYKDLRADFKSNQYLKQSEAFPRYHQTFENRQGFLPNLCILDLLFSEGKNAPNFLLNR
jgi:hypothetical protein